MNITYCNLKISKLICNIFHFIYCVFDIDMHIFLCIEVVVFEIKFKKKFYNSITALPMKIKLLIENHLIYIEADILLSVHKFKRLFVFCLSYPVA